MTPTIVFSKNRACQLDALLSSLDRNAPGMFDVFVLYTCDDHYADGYDRCIDLHPYDDFYAQGDFRDDVLALIADEDGPIAFFVDDDIAYRPVPPIPVMPSTWASFSLRLGGNTVVCYPHGDAEQNFPDGEGMCRIIDNTTVWVWKHATHDLGYPMSLDGHIMDAGLVRTLLNGATFQNPNELEDRLALIRHSPIAPPLMACFNQSVVANVPANSVSATHGSNRVMDAPAYTPEALNEMFLDGWRIDWAAMDYSGVNAAHCELAYAFAKDFR